MKWLPAKINKSLLENGRRRDEAEARGEDCELIPQILLFLPGTSAKWMLASLSPHDPDLAYGLCDLGEGVPELGEVRLSELDGLKGPNGHTVAPDPLFKDARKMDIGEYADIASQLRQIVLEFNATVTDDDLRDLS